MDEHTAATPAAAVATAAVGDASATGLKRKRSPSTGAAAPVQTKTAKTSNSLSINYLARQSPEDLPLIHRDDSLPNLLHLLSSYANILDRHESLASNLGARPLGPILIKRFERCFDAPPKIVASHHKGAASTPEDSSPQITWLEVIEFARSHPNQFTLSAFAEGRRVCQFYYPQKQLRVQISEEDFLFVKSGRCQELIPPLPIWEDEEKEFGTCDVLEAKLKELTNAADMVAARTRQLSHRLKGRRAAILERRAEGGSGTPAKVGAIQTTTAPPSATASGAGFVAVNSTNGRAPSDTGESTQGSSAVIRNELLRHFESLPHNQGPGRSQARHHSIAGAEMQGSKPVDGGSHAFADGFGSNTSSLSPVPQHAFGHDMPPWTTPDAANRSQAQAASQPNRPSSSAANHASASGSGPSRHNFSRPLPPALESSQPFRPLCQAHMDSLPRGHRVLPPCDRCRRLRMDCVKNLTSCAGCTRKHARCHWREVSRDEVGALDHLMDSVYPASGASAFSPTHLDRSGGFTNGGSEVGEQANDDSEDDDDDDDDDSNPLEDLEALGEKEEQETRSREDQEGMGPAQDVTRSGGEESPLPATQSSTIPGHEATTVTSPGHTNGDVHDSDFADGTSRLAQPTRSEAEDNISIVSGAHGNIPARPSYDPVHDEARDELHRLSEGPSSHQTIQVGLASGLGGFRPVNE